MKKFNLESFKMPTFRRFGTYIFLGVVVVLIGTYFAYQFGEVFSPSTLLRSGDPKVELKTSIRSNNTTPLENRVDADEQPNYEDNSLLLLRISGNNQVILPRVQGEIWYE